jgi:hypothetical protein
MPRIWVGYCDDIRGLQRRSNYARRAVPVFVSPCDYEAGTLTYPSHFDFLLRHAMHAVLTHRRLTAVGPSFSGLLFLFLLFEAGIDSEEAWDISGLGTCASSSAFTIGSMTTQSMGTVSRWKVWTRQTKRSRP